MNTIKIIYPKHYRELSIPELKKECLEVFSRKMSGKTVINRATGARIILRKTGAKHALFARTGQFEKIVALTLIDVIIREGAFTGSRAGDRKGVSFVLTFRARVKLDGKTFFVDALARQTSEGKLYYDHAVII